jgi:hypothetical protein
MLKYSNNLINIANTDNQILSIPLNIFNQYEAQNTLNEYQVISYGENLDYVIKNDNQQSLNENLQQELSLYVSKFNDYQILENARLNPPLTLQQKKNNATILLNRIYNNGNTWLCSIENDLQQPISKLENKEQAWLLSIISTQTKFYQTNGTIIDQTLTQSKVFNIKNKLNDIGFSLKIAKDNIQTEINNATTNNIDNITQEYITNEFNQISKIFLISAL